MGQRVVKDMEHAELIARDSAAAEWGGVIQHSEPQILAACAMIVATFDARLSNIESVQETIMGRLTDLERASK